MADDQAPEGSTPDQAMQTAELDAILAHLARAGVNVNSLLADLTLRAKVDALVAALTGAGVVSREALNAEYAPRLLAAARASLQALEERRLQGAQPGGVLVPEHVARAKSGGRKVN